MDRRSHAGRLGWIVSLGVVGLFVAHALHSSFVCDDAFISFRYARNWAEHGEVVFNLGERVEGYTSFLWVALMAAAHVAGIDPVGASRALGILFGALGLLVVTDFVRRLRGRRSPADSLAALLLALSPAWAAWSTGGLETQLFTLLVTLGWTRYLREAAAPGAVRPWSGFTLGLATLARPEGALFLIAIAIHRIATTWRDDRRLVPTGRELGWLASYLVVVAPHVAWRWSYYGWPLPNTYYAKLGGPELWRSGLHYFRGWAVDHSPWALPILATLFSLRLEPGWRRVRSLLLLLTAILTVHVLRAGGDFMELHRFFVPILPGLAVAAAIGLEAIGRAVWRPGPRAWATGLALVAYLGALAGQSLRIERRVDRLSSERGIDSIRLLDTTAGAWADIGRWLAGARPPGTRIAVTAAGAIPYYSRLPTLDLLGLNDERVAHEVEPKGKRPGHLRIATDEHVLEEDVDILIFHPQIGQRVPPPPADTKWRHHGFRWKTVRIPVEPPFWFGFWERESRTDGPRRGRGADPPPSERGSGAGDHR